CRLPHRAGHRDWVTTSVDLDFAKLPAETIMTTANSGNSPLIVPSVVMMPTSGELHTIYLLPLCVFVFVIHVSQNGMWHPRLYSLNQILTIDCGVHPVLPEKRCRDDGYFFYSTSGRTVPATFGHLPAPDCGRVRARRHSRFDEARRVEPDVKLPQL